MSITTEQLRDSLLRYYETYKKVPRTKDCKKEFNLYSPLTYSKRFGSFNDALRSVGLYEKITDKRRTKKVYTNSELLALLDEFYMSNKQTIITGGLLNQDANMPSLSVYISKFKGLTNAFYLIGIDISKHNLEIYKREMIDDFSQLSSFLGRTPTCDDVINYSKLGYCKSLSTYYSHFGNINNVLSLADLPPNYQKKSKEKMILDLIKLKESLGRVPNREELIFESDMASINTYYNVFGNWENALSAAGMTSSRFSVTTNGGAKCLSLYEFWFAEMLELYDIEYEKEIMYRNVIEGYEGLMRFDYSLEINGSKYYIEIFGMVGIPAYDVKITEKVRLCSDAQINLISLFPKDFKNKDKSWLYGRFMSKINELGKAM